MQCVELQAVACAQTAALTLSTAILTRALTSKSHEQRPLSLFKEQQATSVPRTVRLMPAPLRQFHSKSLLVLGILAYVVRTLATVGVVIATLIAAQQHEERAVQAQQSHAGTTLPITIPAMAPPLSPLPPPLGVGLQPHRYWPPLWTMARRTRMRSLQRSCSYDDWTGGTTVVVDEEDTATTAT